MIEDNSEQRLDLDQMNDRQNILQNIKEIIMKHTRRHHDNVQGHTIIIRTVTPIHVSKMVYNHA